MASADRPRRILGIDPGSYATGWGVIVVGDRRPRLEQSGLIRLRRSDPFPMRLCSLQRTFERLVERIRPDLACVEAPFHGVNARAALQLAHSRGIVLAALAGAAVDVEEVAPATVKRMVAGSGRADKAQVEFMIRRLLEIDRELESSDVSDALAIAYCAAVTDRTTTGPAGKSRSSTAGRARTPALRRAR